MEKRKITIEEILVSDPFQRELGDNVIGVNIENTGLLKTFVAWNDKPIAGKGVIQPGSSKPYGLAWPYFLAGQNLRIDFEAGANAQCLVTIIYDNGPHNCTE